MARPAQNAAPGRALRDDCHDGEDDQHAAPWPQAGRQLQAGREEDPRSGQARGRQDQIVCDIL